MTAVILRKYTGSPYVIRKHTTEVYKTEGEFRQPFSLMNPTVTLSGDAQYIFNSNLANYLEVEGRFYYIVDWTIFPTFVVEVKLHLDVLNTYKDEIGNIEVMLTRSSSSNSTELPDGMLPLGADKMYETQHLPKQFSEAEEDGIYIMVTSQKGYTSVESSKD